MAEYRHEDIRELLERPYRIIYQVTPERVTILSVMHYRQLPHAKHATCNMLPRAELSDTTCRPGRRGKD